MTYQAVNGHDNESNLETLSPQPACPQGIQYPVYIHAASGDVYSDGSPFCVWDWENLTESQYEAILDILGLTIDASDVSGPVTIRTVTHNRDTFDVFNATVYHRKGQDTEYAEGLFKTARFWYKQLEAL